ncbi:MAG: PmoA family protein [Abitibacteriaceae bacterium]|nr:PmoA family protein [Abditibacteriaceae bacterium]MBV9866261.1 PmoA family protein [Abditibacteriaceae bacterium]
MSLRYFNRYNLLLALSLCLLIHRGLCANTKAIAVTVSAPDHDLHEVPVSVDVSPLQTTTTPGEVTPCQSEPANDPAKSRLTWMVHDLKKGETRTYYLLPITKPKPGTGVELKRNGENVDFFINGKLFTRYDTTTGPNKPYFYPVNAPTGSQMVRHWPVEKVGDETHDHPHHRGLWFTHSSVNGVDFWTEAKGTGKTVHTGYETIQSGPVYGLMRTKTDWITPDGKKIAEDAREVRVYNVTDGYLLDFTVTVKAVGGPLAWGDNKDGVLGLRVADSMRVAVEKGKTAEGHILNSEGIQDAAAWGKPANWCDYYGSVEGQTVGVAIFDDPKNLRHPTPWHVRDYGLFAANPFGLHDFDKKNAPGAGNYTLPEGQTLTFHYRLLFHKGTTQEAHVAEVWNDFAAPPMVSFKSGK